jgi:hypothetical protein
VEFAEAYAIEFYGRRNESTALWVALPVEAFFVVTYPLVWFLQESANAFTRLFGIQPAPAGVVAPKEREDIDLFAGNTPFTSRGTLQPGSYTLVLHGDGRVDEDNTSNDGCYPGSPGDAGDDPGDGPRNAAV